MNFFRNHIKSIILILINTLFLPLLKLFCFTYPDFTFFVTFIILLVQVITFAWWLFKFKNKEICFTIIICFAINIIAIHSLYSLNKLESIKNSFEFSNVYVTLCGIVIVTLLILFIVKLCQWSNNINFKKKSRNSEFSEQVPAAINNRLDTMHTEKEKTSSSSDGVAISSLPKNSISYILACIFGFIILLGFLVAIFYYIYKDGNFDSWQGWIKAISIFIGCIIGIPFGIYIVIWFTQEIINLLFYKRKSFNVPDIIKKYPASFLGAFIILLLGFIFYNDKFSLDYFINFVSDNLNNVVAFPLMIFVLLAVFLVLTYVLHGIFILLNWNEKNIPPVKIKEFGTKIANDVFKIVDSIYEITHETISGILEFIKFIPCYFIIMSKFVLSQEENDINDINDFQVQEESNSLVED